MAWCINFKIIFNFFFNFKIQRIVETQLLIFNTHLHSACRPEVRDEVIGEMTEALKRWVAARKDSGLRHGKTDEFAAQLYEILTQGKTRHPSVFTEQYAFFTFSL